MRDSPVCTGASAEYATGAGGPGRVETTTNEQGAIRALPEGQENGGGGEMAVRHQRSTERCLLDIGALPGRQPSVGGARQKWWRWNRHCAERGRCDGEASLTTIDSRHTTGRRASRRYRRFRRLPTAPGSLSKSKAGPVQRLQKRGCGSGAARVEAQCCAR